VRITALEVARWGICAYEEDQNVEGCISRFSQTSVFGVIVATSTDREDRLPSGFGGRQIVPKPLLVTFVPSVVIMSISNAAPKGNISYDGLTISLHWITAALVIFLFGSAEMWGFFERGGALRHELQFLHVSCGILLLPVILFRVVWRFAHRGDLPPAAAGLQELLAKSTHLALYVLLVTQITLGFLYRWAQGEDFSFFGLFSLPRIIDIDTTWARPIGELHNDVAWVIVALAGLHALAVLYHHYFLKDRLWARMIP
jgi:cytochrome b561